MTGSPVAAPVHRVGSLVHITAGAWASLRWLPLTADPACEGPAVGWLEVAAVGVVIAVVAVADGAPTDRWSLLVMSPGGLGWTRAGLMLVAVRQ